MEYFYLNSDYEDITINKNIFPLKMVILCFMYLLLSISLSKKIEDIKPTHNPKLKNDFKRLRRCLNKDEYEYRNMLTVAELITESALNRKESRGAHCRSDYNQTNILAEHSYIDSSNEKEVCYA